LDGAVAAALIEVAHEGRAVIRREDHGIAADVHVALGVARMLDIFGRRGGAKRARKAAREAHARALDVAARPFQERERARMVAKLDADLLEKRLGIVLDERKPF